MDIDRVYYGDAVEVLKSFPDNCIDCVVTSPPYFGLRSYLPNEHPNKHNEIGYDQSPEEYVTSIVNVFNEVRRVLKPTGVCWFNIGDSYSRKKTSNIKVNDLFGIPWLCAFALRDVGWYLRSDTIYSKQNVRPESTKNRPISSHEYVFLLSKSPKYYYDWEAIATEPVASTHNDKRPKGILRQRVNANSKYHEGCDVKIEQQFRKQDNVGRSDYTGFNDRYTPVDKVRRRDVWRMTVPGSPIKHFAMFNPKLVELCILSGCPEGGVVLDPFAGANTVGLVAKSLNRHYVGIELNPEYIAIAEEYITNYKYDAINKKVVRIV